MHCRENACTQAQHPAHTGSTIECRQPRAFALASHTRVATSGRGVGRVAWRPVEQCLGTDGTVEGWHARDEPIVKVARVCAALRT